MIIAVSRAKNHFVTENVARHTIKTIQMTFNDFELIYNEMISVYKKDPEVTHIQVNFQVQEVGKEKKIAIINVDITNTKNKNYGIKRHN